MTSWSTNRFPGLLAATAIGIYLLLLLGATTALTDTTICNAWPLCGSGWTLPTSVTGYLVVGHRLAAILVGLLGTVTVIASWHSRIDQRVRTALAISGILYVIQAGIGAVVAMNGESTYLSSIHLLVGMLIFAGVIAALAWTLEIETGDPSDVPSTATSSPDHELPSETERNVTMPTNSVTRAKMTAFAYIRLMKPRLMWLLCLVAFAAMALAGTTGPGVSWEIVLATLGGGVLSIGASGTFNHVLERDVDRRMARTSDRPLATDLVPVGNAIAFGCLLTVASLGLFAWVNLLAAAFGLAAIVFYSIVYTLILKPNTVQNTVLGGFAGALPAFIGWVAVTGEIGFGGLALATVIFLWTPAHFYNLALAYKDDYERGGFPMLPVVRGETATRRHILWYLGATFLATAVLAVVDTLGATYVLGSVALGAVFLWAVIRLHYEQTESAAFRAFHASNAYLGTLLIAIIIDTLAF
ncbi:heme o synthase [Halonotius terrestris]|uniref:heme o synthase n=1 Tax=Halonotius terrestris TaxID=2487750 RepID=UPI001FEB165D|nr:heme o synthase [Halonotius terrestris]